MAKNQKMFVQEQRKDTTGGVAWAVLTVPETVTDTKTAKEWLETVNRKAGTFQIVYASPAFTLVETKAVTFTIAPVA